MVVLPPRDTRAVDSLRRVVAQHPHDTNGTKSLVTRMFNFQSNDKAQAGQYGRQALRLAGAIGADLHDGMGQLLSVVKRHLSALDEELGPRLDYGERLRFGDALAMVDESVREVRGISHDLLHNAMIKNGLRVC